MKNGGASKRNEARSRIRYPLRVVGWIALTATLISPKSSIAVTPAEVAAARDFAVDGVGFSTPLSGLKTRFPSIEYVEDNSDTAGGMFFYRIDSTLSTDGIDVAIFRGKVMMIHVWYFPERVNTSFGSWEVILDRLLKKIGKADEVEEGSSEEAIGKLIWRIPAANRYFEMDVTTERVMLEIVNTDLHAEYKDMKKAKAEVGF